MNPVGTLTLMCGLAFLSCSENNSTSTTNKQTVTSLAADSSTEKDEIQNLLRQTLKWADSNGSIDLLPMLTDSKNSVYVGFDLNKHKANLDKLRLTDLFANEFIENYNQIILTLDRKLKNKEFEQWFIGQLPTFIFANDVNPWTLCQDIPFTNPWDYVTIEIKNLTNYNAKLIWKWGGLDLKANSGWKEFSYNVRTVRENGKWKIAYLQGFDFKESIKKDGLVQP